MAAEGSRTAPQVSASGRRRQGREVLFLAALFGIALAVGGVLQWFSPAWLERALALVKLNSPAAVVALLAALAISVVVHEGGHLVAALLLDFQLMGASLGPFRLQCLHGKWRLQFSARKMFAGSISAVPKELENWRRRMLLVVAAGPVATLLMAAGAVWMAKESGTAGDWLGRVWGGLAEINLLLFVLGLIPNSAQAKVRNDARLFLTLCRHSSAAEEIWLYLWLTQMVLAGVRPQDYPEALTARLANWRGRPDSDLLFSEAMVRWAIDRDDLRLADTWDQRAAQLWADCQPNLRNSALAESACFDALFREDEETARSKFAQVDFETLFPPCFRHRAKATHLLVLGRSDRTSGEIIRAQFALPKDIPYYEYERKWLDRLHMKALTKPKEQIAAVYSAHAV